MIPREARRAFWRIMQDRGLTLSIEDAESIGALRPVIDDALRRGLLRAVFMGDRIVLRAATQVVAERVMRQLETAGEEGLSRSECLSSERSSVPRTLEIALANQGSLVHRQGTGRNTRYWLSKYAPSGAKPGAERNGPAVGWKGD